MANQSYFFKCYCEGWACRGHVVEDGEETHIIRKPSGDELQLCSSCLADYRQDYPAPNTASTGQEPIASAQAEFDAIGERLANNHRKLSRSCH